MKLVLVQEQVSESILENKDTVIGYILSSERNDWIIFPEGMLSGYAPENKDYLSNIDPDLLQTSLHEIIENIKQAQVHCLIGSVEFDKESTYNVVLYIDPTGAVQVYRKNNLSSLDRNIFSQGNTLDIFASEDIAFGIQMCREVRYPEQWRLLKKKGAQIIFHINNALKEQDDIWKHLLVTRAYENQVFVCSVNAYSDASVLGSYLISPSGGILFEGESGGKDKYETTIDLNEVQNYFIGQAREDLVSIEEKS